MATGRPATTTDHWAYEIERLTLGIRCLRIVHQLIHNREIDMADLAKMKPLPPLSGVSGLGNIFKDAAKAIAEVKSAGSSLGSEAAALASDIQTVREHVRREHEDFHFKVATLGNGGATESEKEEMSTKDSSTTFQPGNQTG